MDKNETELRNKISELVADYYNAKFNNNNFIPGKTPVHYAGRVFNEEELKYAVDASLDFWLTSGRYSQEFEELFCEFTNTEYSFLVNSGSSANLLAFASLCSPLLGDKKLQKGDEVISVADTAMVYLPKESNLYLLKGISQLKKEEYDSALQTFKAGVSTVSDEEPSKKVEFYLQIADILASQNKLDSAFVYYENAYQLDPNNATLLNNYAYYLSLINKDLTKAELMSAKTVQAYPDNVSFLDTYAWIFFKQGNMTLAQMYIQQAIDKGGNENGVVMEHYGDILFFNGDLDNAVNWWNKAKEAGNDSKLLEEKIIKQTYIPETKDEK